MKIYGQEQCFFCTKAKEHLDDRGIEYTYIDISKNAEAMQMFREKGLRTVPQIWNEDIHIGGFEELAKVIK